MAATRANKNRKIRQDALREQLANKGLAQQVIEIAEKLNQQYTSLEPTHISALKASADLKMKLISKYLPDLKQQEIIGDPEQPLETVNKIELVALESDSEN